MLYSSPHRRLVYSALQWMQGWSYMVASAGEGGCFLAEMTCTSTLQHLKSRFVNCCTVTTIVAITIIIIKKTTGDVWYWLFFTNPITRHCVNWYCGICTLWIVCIVMSRMISPVGNEPFWLQLATTETTLLKHMRHLLLCFDAVRWHHQCIRDD